MSLTRRNEILSELYTDKDVDKAFGKMQPEELRDDLKAEVFMVLAEMPHTKLIELYERGEVKFYLIRVMFNMVKSTDKKFYKKYRDFVEFNENVNVPDVATENMDIAVTESIDSLYWYDRVMFNKYVEFNNNAKELSRWTGIPYLSVVRTINRVKNELKTKIRNHD